MSLIYLITASIILLYLIYPLWLTLYSSNQSESEIETAEINSVSLILLSYNGQQYLNEKINFLLKELSCFQHYELIIIDDNSTDGSKEILDNFRNTKNIRIILKNEHKGIPHSMNIGVDNAKYENIIFCDQRQNLFDNIIFRIVEPLKFKNMGAVSACISHLDKERSYSVIRRYENFLKIKESKTGNLIGVYGPFYALKKDCFSVIPDHIILDDLYLSLKIIKSKQIKILEDCQIFDEDPSILFNYKRIKRYLYGLLQIINDKALVGQLNNKQLIMLFWHKYLRLFIPFLLFLCFICTGILCSKNTDYLILFCILSVLGIVSVFSGLSKIRFSLKSFIRIIILYIVALADIFFKDICFKRIIHMSWK